MHASIHIHMVNQTDLIVYSYTMMISLKTVFLDND